MVSKCHLVRQSTDWHLPIPTKGRKSSGPVDCLKKYGGPGLRIETVHSNLVSGEALAWSVHTQSNVTLYNAHCSLHSYAAVARISPSHNTLLQMPANKCAIYQSAKSCESRCRERMALCGASGVQS